MRRASASTTALPAVVSSREFLLTKVLAWNLVASHRRYTAQVRVLPVIGGRTGEFTQTGSGEYVSRLLAGRVHARAHRAPS